MTKTFITALLAKGLVTPAPADAPVNLRAAAPAARARTRGNGFSAVQRQDAKRVQSFANRRRSK